MNTAGPPTLHVQPRVHDALWACFVAPVLDGSEGHVMQVSLPPIDNLEALFPIGSVVVDVRTAHGRQLLVRHDGWTALATGGQSHDADVWLRGATHETLQKAAALIRSNAPEPDAPDTAVMMDFWQVGSDAYTVSRQIETPAWADIAQHYPPSVRGDVERLMALTPSESSGRIVLWHGPPGTGKTTAIRALARRWQETVRFQVILDPDTVFAQATTLMQVLLECDEDVPQPWRVLVIEDADELLRSDAKARVGQSLSRLLNVGDGIVGQGTKVLVLITTNEPFDRLHPALARPGRCLAQVEFRRFSRAEAVAWRGNDVPPGPTLSLAEIMAGQVAGDEPDRHTGLYL